MSSFIPLMSPPGRPFNLTSYSTSNEVSLESFLDIISKNDPYITIESYLKTVSLEMFYNDITKLAQLYDLSLAEVVYSLQNQLASLSPVARRILDVNRELLEIRSNVQATAFLKSQETAPAEEGNDVGSLEQPVLTANSQNEDLRKRMEAIEARTLRLEKTLTYVVVIAPIAFLAVVYLGDFSRVAAACHNIFLGI